MDRSNHYEVAFESYLQRQRLSYVAVDETRRAPMGDSPVKSLDFLVFGRDGNLRAPGRRHSHRDGSSNDHSHRDEHHVPNGHRDSVCGDRNVAGRRLLVWMVARTGSRCRLRSSGARTIDSGSD